MDANELAERISEALQNHEAEDPSELGRSDTFEQDGVLTNNTGLQIDIGGRKFQVTVVEA